MREIAYRVYLYPNAELLECLEDLLKCRYKLAKLVGYESYGHRALKRTMAKTPGECRHIGGRATGRAQLQALRVCRDGDELPPAVNRQAGGQVRSPPHWGGQMGLPQLMPVSLILC